MNWTTDRPEKQGYYWAIHKAIKDYQRPVMIEFCKYDTGGASSPIRHNRECYMMGNNVPIKTDEFSHFMGPLKSSALVNTTSTVGIYTENISAKDMDVEEVAA